MAFEINTSILDSVKSTVTKIEEVINPTIQDVLNRAANLIKDLQTQDQMFDKGQKSTGLSITPSYAQSTISIKQKKGQPTDRVTLKDTGDYYESIIVDAQATQLIIRSNITYAVFLANRYGSDVLGLTVENLTNIVNQLIVPQLDKNINNIIIENQL